MCMLYNNTLKYGVDNVRSILDIVNIIKDTNIYIRDSHLRL